MLRSLVRTHAASPDPSPKRPPCRWQRRIRVLGARGQPPKLWGRGWAGPSQHPAPLGQPYLGLTATASLAGTASLPGPTATNPHRPQQPAPAGPLRDTPSGHRLVHGGGERSARHPPRQLSYHFPAVPRSAQLHFIGLLCPRGIAAAAQPLTRLSPTTPPSLPWKERESRLNPCAAAVSRSTGEYLCLKACS